MSALIQCCFCKNSDSSSSDPPSGPSSSFSGSSSGSDSGSGSDSNSGSSSSHSDSSSSNSDIDVNACGCLVYPAAYKMAHSSAEYLSSSGFPQPSRASFPDSAKLIYSGQGPGNRLFYNSIELIADYPLTSFYYRAGTKDGSIATTAVAGAPPFTLTGDGAGDESLLHAYTMVIDLDLCLVEITSFAVGVLNAGSLCSLAMSSVAGSVNESNCMQAIPISGFFPIPPSQCGQQTVEWLGAASATLTPA